LASRILAMAQRSVKSTQDAILPVFFFETLALFSNILGARVAKGRWVFDLVLFGVSIKVDWPKWKEMISGIGRAWDYRPTPINVRG
jgi:hypothetical protein